MSNYNKTWVWVGIVIALIVGGLIGGFGFPAKVVDQDAIDSAVGNATAELNVEIENLKLIIANYTEVEEEEVPAEELGYVIDGVFLNVSVSENLSDRELNLFDGEVEFDGDDYDAEEVFYLNDLLLLANQHDFDGVPYLTVPRGAFEYKLIFEDDLNTSLIGEDDETLTFNLLGEEVTVSKWYENSITFSQGEEYILIERGAIRVNEKNVVLEYVLENAVYVVVDGVGKKIPEGRTKTVNGLEIRVSEVLYTGSATRESKAVLVIGEEVGFEVDNRDEYAEDSIWEWVIDEHSIGLVLVEEFDELDEDYNALALGESICLPNDYLCVVYNGVVEEDSEVYTFELDERYGLEYVEVNGNFQIGTEDTSRIYINTSDLNHTVYDKNWDEIIGTIELGDTGLILNLSTDGNITIKDFVVNFGLNETNVDIEEEDFLTNYGILVENPEDSCEDQEFKITVPEQKLEATISVI